MPWNREIEARIEKVVADWKNTESKKMFGGVCCLQNGNMFCGVHKDFLILRLGKEKAEEALSHPAARPFDITGRPMKGWVMLEESGFEDDETLRAWLEMTRDFVSTLKDK